MYPKHRATDEKSSFSEDQKYGRNYLSVSQEYSSGPKHEDISMESNFDHIQPLLTPVYATRKGGLLPAAWSSAIQFTPDTLIGTSITLACGIGAQLPISVLLVIAIAHLFADGFSICMAEFLESSSHRDFVMTEKHRTDERIREDREGYVQHMIHGYLQKGLPRRDAELIVRTLSRYDEAFSEAVLLNDESLSSAELAAAEPSPGRSSALIYATFLTVGSLPLLPFGLAYFTEEFSQDTLCMMSLLVVLVMNFFVGAEKGLVDDDPRHTWWSSGFSLTANAVLSSGVAFVCGILLRPIVRHLCGHYAIEGGGE